MSKEKAREIIRNPRDEIEKIIILTSSASYNTLGYIVDEKRLADAIQSYIEKNYVRWNEVTPQNAWFLCTCWYCKFIHHPIQHLLKWLDKAWLKIHEKKFSSLKGR
jgi:hypothetical protein